MFAQREEDDAQRGEDHAHGKAPDKGTLVEGEADNGLEHR